MRVFFEFRHTKKTSTMWTEQWSEKHQRPFFHNPKTKKTEWKGHQTVAQLYDGMVRSKTGRLETPLLSLREHTRFVKRSVMYFAQLAAIGKWDDWKQLKALGLPLSNLAVWDKPCLKVLDVACGDGTDLRRWTFDDSDRWTLRVHGLDVSAECIRVARENKREWEGITGFPQNVDVRYEVHDARKKKAWTEVFGVSEPYDIISCMHCLPYFFSSQKVAKAFFQRAAEACRGGGVLVAVYPDEAAVAAHLWGVGKSHTTVGLPHWYDLKTKAPKPRSQTRPPLPYSLSLAGAVPPGAVEHTVPRAGLVQVAKAAGFQVVLHESLQAHACSRGIWQLPHSESYAVSSIYSVFLCVKQ